MCSEVPPLDTCAFLGALLDGKFVAHTRRCSVAGFHYRGPRKYRPRTPPPYAAHSREPATPRPYCRVVGLRSLRLGTAGEWAHLIWTFPSSSIRSYGPSREERPGPCGLGALDNRGAASVSSPAIEAHEPVRDNCPEVQCPGVHGMISMPGGEEAGVTADHNPRAGTPTSLRP